MKTFSEVINSAPEDETISAWREDEFGVVLKAGLIEIRVEPLLFNGALVAVYEFDEWGNPKLIGEKLPLKSFVPME